MTNEDKNLLLKDLCARLSYGVVIQEYNEEHGYAINFLNTIGIGYFSVHEASIEGSWINHIENVRPFLRPMSSMTEEEKKEFEEILEEYDENNKPFNGYKFGSDTDWLNFHHFDYRELIEIGLALEAPEGMYNV